MYFTAGVEYLCSRTYSDNKGKIYLTRMNEPDTVSVLFELYLNLNFNSAMFKIY